MKHEQLTAWALNELSPEEKAELEAALHEDAAAQKQAAETRDFCGFLSAHLFDADIALGEEQRAALRQAAAASTGEKMNATAVRTAAAPAAGKRPWWERGMTRALAVAAAVTLLAASAWLVLPDQGGRQPESVSTLALNESASPRTAAPKWKMIETPKEGGSAPMPTLRGDANAMLRTQPVDLAAATLPFGPVPPGSPVPPRPLLAQNAPATLGAAASTSGTLDYEELDLSTSLTPQRGLGHLAPGAPPAAGGMLPGAGSVSPQVWTASAESAATANSPTATPRPTGVLKDNAPMALEDSSGLITVAGIGASNGGAVILDGAGREVGTLVRNPAPAAVGGKALPALTAPSAAPVVGPPAVTLAVAPAAGRQQAASAPTADAYGINAETRANGYPYQPAVGDVIPPAEIHPKPAPSDPGLPELEKLPGVGGFFKKEAAKPNTESYTPIVENILQDVTRAPLSTFSIDVDTASYANVRRFLNQNTAPPPDAVRIEELINYFPTNAEGPPPQAKEPFAVGIEMAECPWQPLHRLARINIKGRELGGERKPSNLVFLVDVSGSMNEPDKLPLVRQSLRMLAEKLGEEDRVSMVVYAGSSGLVLPPTHGLNKAEILGAIDRLQAGGSTHGSAGIQLAYQQAVSGFIKGGVNRVILCTDGDFNVGVSSPEALEKLITEKARSGVFLSVLGYGSGNLKDRTMETLADKGNGNYAYIDSLSEARKVLVEQMGGTLVTIAKDVKIQVEFNPRVVRSYRLIGYENRLLAKEDFNDDTKDAGEIGAGHSVTALYELVPANLPPGAEPRRVVDDLKYQPAAAAAAAPAEPAAPGLDPTLATEALTVKLRYKEPEGSTSQLIEVPVTDDAKRIDAASGEFKFTAAVAGFGLLLRHSSYAGDLTWDKVRDLAQQGKGSDANGYRGEFLQLIEKARGVSGR